MTVWLMRHPDITIENVIGFVVSSVDCHGWPMTGQTLREQSTILNGRRIFRKAFFLPKQRIIYIIITQTISNAVFVLHARH